MPSKPNRFPPVDILTLNEVYLRNTSLADLSRNSLLCSVPRMNAPKRSKHFRLRSLPTYTHRIRLPTTARVRTKLKNSRRGSNACPEQGVANRTTALIDPRRLLLLYLPFKGVKDVPFHPLETRSVRAQPGSESGLDNPHTRPCWLFWRSSNFGKASKSKLNICASRIGKKYPAPPS